MPSSGWPMANVIPLILLTIPFRLRTSHSVFRIAGPFLVRKTECFTKVTNGIEDLPAAKAMPAMTKRRSGFQPLSSFVTVVPFATKKRAFRTLKAAGSRFYAVAGRQSASPVNIISHRYEQAPMLL